jgi:hypothetical protein
VVIKRAAASRSANIETAVERTILSASPAFRTIGQIAGQAMVIVQIEKTFRSRKHSNREDMPMPKFVRSLVALAIATACSAAAVAQSQSTKDEVDPAHKNPIRVRDMANRPCITVKGRTVQDKINTAIVNHYLRAANSCSKMIKIKACYTQSARCTEFTLHSLERKEVLFGTTNSSMPILNFDFTEKEVM